jgi:hypothetical protein
LTTGAFHLRKVSLWKARVRPPNTRQATRVSHWPSPACAGAGTARRRPPAN